MNNKLLKYYPFLPLLLLCGYYLFKAISFPTHDFANYYFGGKFLTEGNFNTAIYFPFEFNKAIFDSGHTGIFASYAPNTPFLALFFAAFSAFSLAVAKLVLNLLSVVLFIFSLYRLFNYYKINWRYTMLIPVLFLIPIKNNLLFGQVYFFLLFLLTEGWLAYERERSKSMAFFWSLAILLKVFPAILIALLLFRKQWKPLCWLIACCGLLFGITVLFTGTEIWSFYFKEVLPKASSGEIASSFVPNYQSVFMFLKELFVFDAVENPKAFFHYPVLLTVLVVGFKTAVLVLGYFVSKRSSSLLFAFAYWIVAMILFSPYGSTYTLILLLFPFLTLLKSNISNIKKMAFCSVIFLICNIPLSLFLENPFPFSYLRLFLLLLFFALFIFQFQHQPNWKIVVVYSVLPMILLLIFKKNEINKSTILLEDVPILVYDYKIENINGSQDKELLTYFWDGQQNIMLWETQIQSVQPLTLKKNQVFYQNQQLTFDKSNKLKPMLIDHKMVIYLSDYDRGIGFYTLRKIELK